MRSRLVSAAVLGAFAAITTLTSNASADPKLKRTEAGVALKWGGAMNFVLDDSLDKIDVGAKDAVKAALTTWLASGTNLPPITVQTDGGSRGVETDGVSRILYEPITSPGHEGDVAITITSSDADTGEILETDIILNSTFAYGVLDAQDTPSCDKRYDVQNVTTHELGHAFGLGEDDESADATMYFTSSPCETKKRDLAPSDTAALASVYGEGTPPELSEGAPSPRTPSPPPPKAGGCAAGPGLMGDAPLGTLAFVFLAARRRRSKRQ